MSHGGTVVSGKRKRESRWSPVVEPPPETREWLEETASLVARKGMVVEKRIKTHNVDCNFDYKNFSFLLPSDPSHAFYQQRVQEYRVQYRDGTLQEPENSLIFSKRALHLKHPPLSECLRPLSASICDSAFTFPPGLTLKELGIIKLTAQFMARYGLYFWGSLLADVYTNPHFQFMKTNHSSFGFYTDLVVAYSRVLRTSTSAFNEAIVEPFLHRLQLEKLDQGVETAMVDLHAFLGGVDCFTHMEYAHHSLVRDPPQRLSMMMNPLPQLPPDQNQDDAALDTILPDLEDPALMFPARITLKELGVMKLTAQFVARYGKYFRRALMMRVVMLPQFEFMEKTHSRHFFFNVLVDAYTDVLRPTKKLKANEICTANVLEVFFNRFQLDKLENGAEMAMVDMHAFVGGLDFFAHRANRHFSAVLPPPEPISTTRKWLSQPDVLLQRTLGPLLSKYLAKTLVIEGDPLAPGQSVADFFRIPPQRSLSFAIPANITLKELGVMKLTAQFVTWYGLDALRDLMKRPQFEFMNGKSRFYNGLLEAYVGVLNLYKKPKKRHLPAADSVLEVFLRRLQLEKLEEGAETAMIDLNALMSGIDYFAHMDDINYSAVMLPPLRFSTMMNRVTQMRPDMPVQPPFGSQHSEYRAQNEDGAQDIQRDPPATQKDAQPDLELPPFRYPIGRYGLITPEELVIMKMTAMFTARYGTHFCRELMKRVDMEPWFEFMRPDDWRFNNYNVFVDAYSRVVKPSNDACTATVLKGFFGCLQLEKLEGGVDTAMLDLHAFVSGVDSFAETEEGLGYCPLMEKVDYSAFMPQPQSLSMINNWRAPNRAGGWWLKIPLGSQIVRLQVHPNPYPRPYDQFASLAMGMLVPSLPDEEPEPKRQEFDESALVRDDQYLGSTSG